MLNYSKAILRNIDDSINKGRLKLFFYRNRVYSKLKSLMRDKNNLFSTIYFKKDLTNILSQLCDKYGSDKGEIDNSHQPYNWPAHSYSEYYYRLFSHCRLGIKKVFECGIGTTNTNIPCSMGEKGKPGASLRVWRDFFPNATIYGADIDKNILFSEKRIKTFYIDQLDSKAISNFWKNIGLFDFDFIVDDGLHTFKAGITLFKNSIERLSQTGIYVIEDVKIEDLILYKDFFDEQDFNVDYVLIKQPKLLPEFLVVIRKKQKII